MHGPMNIKFNIPMSKHQGHCAISRKVAGSIPNGVNGIFH
jgi:hypothetical protein